MIVAIQPSYGNPDAVRHFHETLERLVPFGEAAHRQALTETQFATLAALHPDLRAPFWGGTQNQTAAIADLGMGDIVIFTGGRQVRGIGEVGFVFQNAAFANTMWNPHPDRGPFLNVYSLRSFQPTDLPYQTLRDAVGSSEGDNFMGLRLIRDDDRISAVLDLVDNRTITGDQAAIARSVELATQLAEELGQEQFAPIEKVVKASGSYPPAQREIVFTRTEGLLVQTYAASLPEGTRYERIRCAAGVTDMYVADGDAGDLIEAKSGATHPYIRQALGQILDYAYAVTSPISTLSVLVPERPSDRDLNLLSAYGIDCVYKTGTMTFERHPAPAGRRSAWRKAEG